MTEQGKAYRKSNASIVAATRLPPEINAILERRAKYHRDGKSGYMRERLTYDLTRKHVRSKRNGNNDAREELGLGQQLVASEQNVGSNPTSRLNKKHKGG